MKYSLLFSVASLESLSSSVSGETVIKVLHVNSVPEAVAGALFQELEALD